MYLGSALAYNKRVKRPHMKHWVTKDYIEQSFDHDGYPYETFGFHEPLGFEDLLASDWLVEGKE